MVKRIKTAIITGANSGMGKASARMLAEKGYEVLMLVRDQKRGEVAFRELQKEYPDRFEMVLCDLSDASSIREAAEIISMKYSHVDLLINNAGLITTQRELTKDGLEMQFAVNHVGHFQLTMLLLPLMHPGSRIVQVASGAHKWGKINFEDLTMEKSFRPFKAYGQSKLANVLFAEALSRKLIPYGVTVNSCHPGAVGTNMGVNRETGFGKGIMKLLKPFSRLLKKVRTLRFFLAQKYRWKKSAASTSTTENLSQYQEEHRIRCYLTSCGDGAKSIQESIFRKWRRDFSDDILWKFMNWSMWNYQYLWKSYLFLRACRSISEYD